MTPFEVLLEENVELHCLTHKMLREVEEQVQSFMQNLRVAQS